MQNQDNFKIGLGNYLQSKLVLITCYKYIIKCKFDVNKKYIIKCKFDVNKKQIIKCKFDVNKKYIILSLENENQLEKIDNQMR